MIKFCVFIVAFCIGFSCSHKTDIIEPDQYVNYTPLEPIRLSYGPDSLQYGDLRMPDSEGKANVIMILHGGCWLSAYDLSLMENMSEDLANRGYATWNVEYRRTEDPGGGWPGTFIDVAEALKYLEQIAENYPIDLSNILVTGHSAGGHLALSLGMQSKLDTNSEIKVNNLPTIKGIVSLAGITDLASYYQPNGCGSNTANLLGGTPGQITSRYLEASPINHLPLGVPTILINGVSDNIVPVSHVQPYFDRAVELGEDIRFETITSAGHFDVIQPGSVAWDPILNAFEEILD